jgi:hypothetical protein
MRTRPASAAGDGLILRFDPRRGRRGLVEDGWTFVETGGVAVFGGDGSIRLPKIASNNASRAYKVRASEMLLRSELTVVANAETSTTLGEYKTICSNTTESPLVRRWEVGIIHTTGKMFAYNGGAVVSTNAAVFGGKTHLVWVFTGGNVYFYDNVRANGSAACALSTTLKPLDIQVSTFAAVARPWFDRIYDLRVYNRAWTASEVLDDYREYA